MWKPAGTLLAMFVVLSLAGNVALVTPAVAHPSELPFSVGLDQAEPISQHVSPGTNHHCSNGAGCAFLILNGGSMRTPIASVRYVRVVRCDFDAGRAMPPAAPPPKFAALI